MSKDKQSWKTSTCVILIGVVSGCIAIFTFVTGFEDIREILAFIVDGAETTQPTNTPLPATATLSPTQTPLLATDTLIPSQEFSPDEETSIVACKVPTGWVTYVVQPGDTLTNIAGEHGTTQADLQTVNCLNSTEIFIGQVLYVPNEPLASKTQAPTPTNIPTLVPTFTLSPTPAGLPTLIMDDYGVPMALVPAGPFQMGSENGDDDEKPVHTVTLDDFYIDQYEVTNARYADCVNVGVCDPPSNISSHTRESYYGNTEYADYPLVLVDWNVAQAYCQWRGARLPTEAEWEKAARGGLEGADYPWGNTFDTMLVNYCDVNCPMPWKDDEFNDGYAETTPIGTYPPNGYELYDMASNVSEWTADWYDSEYYASSPQSNPFGPSDGIWRVLRGSSWADGSSSFGVASRGRIAPSANLYTVGFRCARGVP